MSQIIKVYNTEANALIGGGTGMIGSATIPTTGGNGGAIHNGTDSIPYYIYNKYFYRIESNELVSEFHIDWDDGEDNSLDKRNIEIIKLKTPAHFAVTSHIYTQAKRFFPLVRVKSTDGFLSKFYTNNSSDNDFSGFAPVQKDSSNNNTVTYSAGQNLFSQISLEKDGSDLIPHFLPSNLPPISMLKSDKSRVKTGIDNRPIDDITTANYPLLYAYTSSSNSLGTDNLVKLTMQVREGQTSTGASGAVREFILKGDDVITANSGLNGASGATSELATHAVPFGNYQTGTDSFETVDMLFKTDNAGDTSASNGDKTDLTGDYFVIYAGSLPYLVWFDVSGSDSQPSVPVPSGTGSFADIVEVDLSSTTDTNTAIATQVETVCRARTGTGQIGHVSTGFTITNPSDAIVQFVSNIHGNEPDIELTDAAKVHIKDAGEQTDSYNTDGSSNVNLTDCANKLLKAELLNVGKLADTERLYVKVFEAKQSSLDGGATVTYAASGSLLAESGFDTTETDVTVDDGTDFLPNQYIKLEDEIMRITSISSNVLTVTRGAKGTTATAHGDNTPIFLVGNEAVCVLSNGNPIVEFNDPHSNVNLDGSESFTKDSSLSISNYYYDDDSLDTATIQAQASLSSKIGQMSDTFSVSASTDPRLSLGFTNDSMGHLLDSDSRFLDFYRLIRLQVADDNTIITNQGDVANRRSFVEHYDDDQYVSTVNSGASLIPTAQESRGYIALSNSDTSKEATWFALDTLSRTNATMIGGHGDHILRPNPDTSGAAAVMTNAPKNFMFMCKTDIFDRVYFRTNHDYVVGDTVIDVDISAYYSHADGWKPLEIVDKTSRMQTSGYIKFKIPSDWAKTTSSGIESGTWTGPVNSSTDASAKSGHDPASLWDFSAYGILVAIDTKAADNTKLNITNVWPFNNSHSKLIKVQDSHHVSLNNIAIAQSISFSRSTNFQTITDRFGKSEIRKIGAKGGSVTFGSVDLGDTDAKGNRKKIKEHQQNATPVFLDVTHKSGEKTRFFGVITQMSEDHPVGGQFPKYAVTMQVSHLIELDSSNNLLSDKISIGGNIDDTRKFVSSA